MRAPDLSGAEAVRPWPLWAEALAVGAFWALFIAAALVARALDAVVPFTGHTVAVTLAEYGPWLVVTPVVFWLAWRVPLVGTRWVRSLAIHVGAGVALVLAVGGVQESILAVLGPPPGVAAVPRSGPPPDARPPSEAPRRAPDGPPPNGPPPDGPLPNGLPGMQGGRPRLFTPSLNLLLYLVVLGVGVARGYAAQAAVRRAEAERLEAQVAEARLEALRMQLRPHFLFNALNAVAALAGEDPAEVRRIVARLSSLLRRVLDADARPLVPLREELAFARDYLDLQRVRFERLDVDEDIDDSLLDALVPTLVLQPLVENAVEHGAAARGGGQVWIGARQEDDHLVLTVADDGPGLAAGSGASDHRSVGLDNTRARLAAHYSGDGLLVLRERPGGGAEAVVTLPFDDPDA